jgi:hypothetical protein
MQFRFGLCLMFFCLFLRANATQSTVKQDSLLTILQMPDENLRERKLVLYLRYYFGDMPENDLNAAKVKTSQLMQSHKVANRTVINFFIETLCQIRLKQFSEAEKTLVKAIALANKASDDYLLYACFTHLGFLQTYQGNTIEAISSFGMAKKEATTLNDAYLQVVIDVNISDIYYKNNLYSQSLYYLNQAQSLMLTHQIKEPMLKNAINNNKAEIYFRMNNVDSLKRYNEILNNSKEGTYRLYVYRKRTDYYLDLLHHDYPKAINSMQVLRKDKLFAFDDTDKQNLAEAYFQAGQPDSARAIINSLLTGGEQNNHPEIKLHLYETLGQIAENKNDKIQAADNFKMALQQAREQISRLTRVDTISAQIKLDEIQGDYNRNVESYNKQRLWLIFTVIITVLTLVIGALFYLNIRRKKYYEKLLFNTKKKELAYINSHEVRRHLSNILGIIDVIKHSEDQHKEYVQLEEHLLEAAASLDTAIKNISAKLDD